MRRQVDKGCRHESRSDQWRWEEENRTEARVLAEAGDPNDHRYFLRDDDSLVFWSDGTPVRERWWQ